MENPVIILNSFKTTNFKNILTYPSRIPIKKALSESSNKGFSDLGLGKILVPLQLCVDSGWFWFFFMFLTVVELGEIHLWHKFCLHVIYCVVQGVNEFSEILFIEKDLVFFISKPFIVFVVPLLTLGNSQVVVIRPGCLHIKKVGPFSCLYFFGVNLITSIRLVLFHRSFSFRCKQGN
jgi:hypothetical protein